MKDDVVRILLAACEDISRQIVLKSHAMASTLGLSPSDFEYLSLLVHQGPTTAGGLATATGLTTGAITGIIDRLEEEGFVTRQHDNEDRRRIMVVPTKSATEAIQAYHEKMERDFGRCLAGYSYEKQQIILNFLRSTNDFLREETAKITRE